MAEPIGRESLDPKVASYIDHAIAGLDGIPADRRKTLESIARFVQERIEAGQDAKLTFICTHNSRRSQLAQVWAQTAACYYGIPSVEAYSGGVEATACNSRTVAALERAGLATKKTGEGANPIYEIAYCRSREPIKAFSKVYSESPNPASDYCAIMVCDHADSSCPLVKGCARRVALLYEDPKKFDGTPDEAAKYDERCAQICGEMLYLFSRVDATRAGKR